MSNPQVVGRIPPKAYYAMHDFKLLDNLSHYTRLCLVYLQQFYT